MVMQLQDRELQDRLPMPEARREAKKTLPSEPPEGANTAHSQGIRLSASRTTEE